MRALALNTAVILTLLAVAAEGRTELDLLQARCAEQERQITALEIEVEQLRERIAFERRRARTSIEPITTVSTTPAPAAKPAAAKTNAEESYTVKGGDTISAISRRYAVSPQDLMTENGIEDPTRLRVGQKLTIPVKEAAKKAPAAVASTPAPAPRKRQPAAQGSQSYTVQSGDTLSRVARLHSMNYSEIVSLNPDIVPDRLLVGQKLNVAGKADPSRKVAVEKKSPTKTHQIAANKPTPKPAAKPAEPTPQPTPENTITPVTVSDEISFGAFAARHNTTPERLNALNGLRLKSSTVLAKGSELYVVAAN